MSYRATVHQLLVSAPGDIPEQDLRATFEAIYRWNVLHGLKSHCVVVPMHWQVHSAAEHGRRPQASLDAQLVDVADIVVALFWHRLGSPTGEERSGTLEEINRAQRNEKYVAILRCERDYPQHADLDQIGKLKEFYGELEDESLILGYRGAGDLAQRVDTILSRAVPTDTTIEEGSLEVGVADVRPRLESSEQVKANSRGQIRTSRTWALVLKNHGSEPARNVIFRLEAEDDDEDALPRILDSNQELETLLPDGEAPYPLFRGMGMASQFRCVVSWEDSAGPHEATATLRF